MKKVTVRRASTADLDAFSDMPAKPTTLAWVAEIEGTIIGLGGLALIRGRWFAFLDLADEARPYKMTLMRTAVRVMAETRRQGIRFLYAERDQSEAGAETWLKSLGFEIDPRSDHYYRWSAKNSWQD